MKVLLFATCRKEELLPYTLMVFRTIRVGFPSADIVVHGNALKGESLDAVRDCCNQPNVAAEFDNLPASIHHLWVEDMVNLQSEPFILSDTDCIYYDSVEDWKFNTSLAGWRIPEWRDDFSGCVTRARLHTSLLFIDPVKLSSDVAKFYDKVFESEFTPRANLFHPLVLPFKRQSYFYDTCSMLYHAVGGTAFTEVQLENYTHMNFGTISDIVLPRLPKETADAFRIGRAAILQNPTRGKGAWRLQNQFYRDHPA